MNIEKNEEKRDILLNRLIRRIKMIIHHKNTYEKFIKHNSHYWRRFSVSRNSGKILVEFSEKNPFELETNMRVAKAIQKKYSYKIEVLYSGFSRFREPYVGLIESYFIDKLFYVKQDYIFNFITWFRSYKESKEIFKKISNLRDIENLTYMDIHIGDLIYDNYIRLDAKVYSPLIDKTLLKTLTNAIFYCKVYNRYIDEDVKYMVAIDKCYIKHGIFTRLGVKKGIPVIFPTKQLKILNEDNLYRHVYHPEKDYEEILNEIISVDVELEVNRYLKERFSGSINQIDVLTAYRYKKIYTRKSIEEMLNLDRNKKNAVIMPHAFSDFPHIDLGLFPDYYQWLMYLLNKIKNLNTVNWLIKPHPTAYFFNEVGAIEKILCDMNITNVKVVPQDMSTASIKDIADVILTVRGTSGLEFSTFGIPVVNAGRGCYSGYGFNFEASSIKEYDTIIENIDKVERLNEDKIYRAKVILYYLFVKDNIIPKYLCNDLESVLKDYCKALYNILDNNDKEKPEDNILYKEVWEAIG